ncbi:MAG TPA: hypothetical protein VM821_06630 [Abditibacteriaceae bacterium]|jgi:hypothetical protein|nr:hypothetical protein [Abditibacteriaceae bacterium]
MKTDTIVVNCDIKFRFECPKLWQNLDDTQEPDVKFCDACQREVFLCSSDEETMEHAEQGHCIARARPHFSTLPMMVIGEIESGISPTAEQRKASEANLHECAIESALRDMKITKRRCANCGYPMWLKKCRVCGGNEVVLPRKNGS